MGYLVGLYGVSVLVGVNHCQRDRHGVVYERDSDSVTGDLRQHLQGRHAGRREPGGDREILIIIIIILLVLLIV